MPIASERCRERQAARTGGAAVEQRVDPEADTDAAEEQEGRAAAPYPA